METRWKQICQIVYGVLLVLVGMGLFFRIPQIMQKVAQIEHYRFSTLFIRICFYLLGILLIGGGIKKINNNYKLMSVDNKNSMSE